MRITATILVACLALIGCAIPKEKPVTSSTTGIHDSQNDINVETFETTQVAREQAQAQGLPVLLHGNRVSYPSGVDPSKQAMAGSI